MWNAEVGIGECGTGKLGCDTNSTEIATMIEFMFTAI